MQHRVQIYQLLSSVQASDVTEEFGSKVKYVLDGGKCAIGLESTIINLLNKPEILRLGGLDISKIEKILQKKILIKNSRILSDNNSFILKLIIEGLGAIKDIIILKRYNFFSKSFFKYRFSVSKISAFNQTSAIIPRNIIEMVAFSMLISLILINLKGNFMLNNSFQAFFEFYLCFHRFLNDSGEKQFISNCFSPPKS